MTTTKISGTAAWLAAVKGTSSIWSDHINRFSEPIARATYPPKFHIDPGDKFFCIGSCFARNIEEHLIYRGVDVLSRRVISPKIEWPNRVNGFVNKFTTHSMRNELEWVSDPPNIDQYMFEEQQDGWADLQLCPGVALVSLDRAIERRFYLTSNYFSRMQDASVVVLTLGLNEVWFDRNTARHLNAPPSFYATRRDPQRYELHITDVVSNVIELEKIRQIISKINPLAKIIVTVSPVPMSNTFSARDVLISNMYSKSTLRAAADIFCQSHDNVDYFPSYDMIAMSPRNSAYSADCLHVTDAIVGAMMQSFFSLYLGSEPHPIIFSELAYLAANPDVEDALRRAEFGSGFEHWHRYGREENRPLSPPDGPTALMIATGAV